MNEENILVVDCGVCSNKQSLVGDNIQKYEEYCVKNNQLFICTECQGAAEKLLLAKGIDLRIHKNPYPSKKGKVSSVQSIPIYDMVGDKKVLKGYKYLKHG